jgi:peptidoglycan/xylan/chitin deacetylase (PgdA/CDA1 family)
MLMTGGFLAGTYYPNAPFFGPVTGRGPRRRELYLTFDDGPNPRSTPLVLETLAREGVLATFFMVGRFVRRHPDLARAAAVAGHAVGNHTLSHRKLPYLGGRAVTKELAETHRCLEEVTGTSPRFFRAPHGYRSPAVARVARQLGYRTIGWTFGVWDSNPISSEKIRRRVKARLRPGAIILLHDGDGYDPEGDRRPTAGALPGIIRDAREAGYTFLTLDSIWTSGAGSPHRSPISG